MNAKNIVIAILALVLIGAVSYLLLNSGEDTVTVTDDTTADTEIEITPAGPDDEIDDSEPPKLEVTDKRDDKTTLGTSVNGTDVVAHHFGTGKTEVLLIGGVHGSYSPNTSEVANEAIAYFEKNVDAVPDNIMLTIIPNLNPDGQTLPSPAGRFNAINVDLNRNFDCEWSATGIWKDKEVSGGSKAFSEPETQALRDYVEKYNPKAAIVWFSAEGKVYPSSCSDPSGAALSPDSSIELAATFATAAGYPAAAKFDHYAITGDMVNWMAKEGIPAISVLLSDHKSSEWTKNRAGVEAVLKAYTE